MLGVMSWCMPLFVSISCFGFYIVDMGRPYARCDVVVYAAVCVHILFWFTL